MTAKKQSLLDKNVIRQDYPDAARLLARDNVNYTQLCNFACEAAQFATKSSSQFKFQFAVNDKLLEYIYLFILVLLFNRKIIMVQPMYKCLILHHYFMLSMLHVLLNVMVNKY